MLYTFNDTFRHFLRVPVRSRLELIMIHSRPNGFDALQILQRVLIAEVMTTIDSPPGSLIVSSQLVD